MIYREPRLDEKELYETLTRHPLQSWAWGDFRDKTGVVTKRLIGFEGDRAVSQIQLTFHPIPHLPYTIGYFPKGVWPDESQLAALQELGKREKAIFIKLEPDVSTPPKNKADLEGLNHILLGEGCRLGRPLFTKYSFILDLTLTDDAMLAKMKSKTRYNIHVAQKHGVEVVEDNGDEAFDTYLSLLHETTSRQHFFAHTDTYHKNMWQTMRKAGIAHLLKATYQGKVITTWILFKFKDKLYYPYGASSRAHREVMASNLVMWTAIHLGKSWGCTSFDLWGALGPEPDPKDPWIGFHNFKLGYGGDLAEFVGSYDLVINAPLYSLYTQADVWRWRLLKLLSKLPL
jgi:lipid II:glycine glycyltransferase (peptidoglycan interpeptide bridge formation enzyme)